MPQADMGERILNASQQTCTFKTNVAHFGLVACPTPTSLRQPSFPGLIIYPRLGTRRISPQKLTCIYSPRPSLTKPGTLGESLFLSDLFPQRGKWKYHKPPSELIVRIKCLLSACHREVLNKSEVLFK